MIKSGHRSCEYEKDKDSITELIIRIRLASDIRLYPTVWRVRLLLTSRVREPEKDTRIWEDENGEILALVMLWRRTPTSPYIVLDGFVDPEHFPTDLMAAVFEWGNHRAEEILLENKEPATIFANGFHYEIFKDQITKTFGYSPVTPDPQNHNIYFSRSLNNKLNIPALPEGYRIQPLIAPDEIDQYASLYGFAKVNPEHQIELIKSSEYHHLTVVDKNGAFAAYCEYSICMAEWQKASQRIGWIDYIETRPDHQNKGLGMAVLHTALAHLQKSGVDTAMLVTVSSNLPAVGLYQKAGFDLVELEEPQRYQKEIKNIDTAGSE